jgi:hypothetical protein
MEKMRIARRDLLCPTTVVLKEVREHSTALYRRRWSEGAASPSAHSQPSPRSSTETIRCRSSAAGRIR